MRRYTINNISATAILWYLCATVFAVDNTTKPEFRPDGLLLYFSFDKNSSDVIIDGSGKANNGAVRGAQYTANGKSGGAYVVGRNVGYIEVPDNDAWSFDDKPFSIALWFRRNSKDDREQMLVGHDEGAGSRNKWALEIAGGNLCFHVFNTRFSSARIARNPWEPQMDQWYHLTLTRSRDEYRIYIDGTCVATESNKMPIPSIKAPLTIGKAEDLFVEGVIDEVMIFRRELSKTEIKKLYASYGN